MSKSGIVNVRMVITEEKILSNIDKIHKIINPKSKKQIVQLEEDTYFKDLIESVKTYLIEYPKKKNFPISVYKAAYGLVEFATNQFEENTKKIEELIRQREENIISAGKLKELVEAVENKDKEWKDKVKNEEGEFPEDIIETLTIVGKAKGKTSQNYQDAMKLLNARINNLESNLHIEIDMERIEDRSKALSFIGIEIADALKTIPAPVETVTEVQTEEVKAENVEKAEKVKKVKKNKKAQEKVQVIQEVKETNEQNVENIENSEQEKQEYIQETTFETKPSLWERIKNSKLVRTIKMITRIRIVIDYTDALPEGNKENNQ